MKKFGLLGKKLGHSLSPFIHNILFEISGINAEYLLYETDDVNDFVKNNHLDGFNITIPYKKDVFGLCQKLDKSCYNLGVVNCVDSNLTGYNTDVYGYCESVKELADFTGNILLLGCGGVGSMIAKQYEDANLCVAVRNLTKEKALNIQNQFKGCEVVDISAIPKKQYDLICNSTPVGMYPHIENSPIDYDVVSCSKAVYDTIYNPYLTKLLQYAERAGIKYKNGLEMLVLQAVKSHEYWYGGVFEDSDIAKIITLTKGELEKW